MLKSHPKGYAYLSFDPSELHSDCQYYVQVKLDDEGVVIDIINEKTESLTDFSTWTLYEELK